MNSAFASRVFLALIGILTAILLVFMMVIVRRADHHAEHALKERNAYLSNPKRVE